MSGRVLKIEDLKGSKSWRPFRATDFESLMYPNFLISLVFGCFPYKCESSSYVFSRARFIYSTLVIVVYVALLASTVYQINFSTLYDNHIPKIIHSNLSFVLNGGIILLMHLTSRSRLRVLQDLYETSQILSPEDYNYFAKILHTKDIFGFLILVFHTPRFFQQNVHSAILHITVLYITMVTFSLDMFYVNCVCILKACFKKINENLLELKQLFANDKLDLETPLAEKFLYRGERNPLLLMKLKHFEERHLHISDVVQSLNKTFLVRIILLSVSTFTSVTFNLYFYILWVNRGDRNSTEGQFGYRAYLSPAFYYMIKFSLMIWTCETATNQALEIGTTLHDVHSCATDKVVKRELKLFSLQVLHRDNTFSAKAVTMNASLLAQMIGGVVMYLLILFQFLLNSINCIDSL
ncbi:uncharacterized protein LOC143374713 [Andrena cerasifolii]|uniref:uncharacterized protein LOC143374713 n=1 Tax=Andrena cerasifolii TaxID=2819439 RepID=UPI004037EDD4